MAVVRRILRLHLCTIVDCSLTRESQKSPPPHHPPRVSRGLKSPRSVAGWDPDGGRSHNAFAWLQLIRHRREIDGQTELIMRKSIKRRGSAGFIRPSCELVSAEERSGAEGSRLSVCRCSPLRAPAACCLPAQPSPMASKLLFIDPTQDIKRLRIRSFV